MNPREHEFEPQPGLPETLPAGERILWQGAPAWTALVTRAFHADLLAGYFAVLLCWRAANDYGQSHDMVHAALSVLGLLPLALFALAVVIAMAWLAARTTLYTITDRRVVMRIGVVLNVTFNVPFTAIDGADLKTLRAGAGEIALRLVPGTKIAFLHLWPHARPWRLARPEPMLRGILDAGRVAQVLGGALVAAAGAQSATTAAGVVPAAPIVTGTSVPAGHGAAALAPAH